MKTFSCRTTIQAPPETIWKLLIDAPGYPTWNPTFERIDGRIAPGEKITVFAKINPGRAFPVETQSIRPFAMKPWTRPR